MSNVYDLPAKRTRGPKQAVRERMNKRGKALATPLTAKEAGDMVDEITKTAEMEELMEAYAEAKAQQVAANFDLGLAQDAVLDAMLANGMNEYFSSYGIAEVDNGETRPSRYIPAHALREKYGEKVFMDCIKVTMDKCKEHLTEKQIRDIAVSPKPEKRARQIKIKLKK